MIIIVDPIIQPFVKQICLTRYKAHPKGCPNYNKKAGCPTNNPLTDTPMYDDYYDLSQPVYAIICTFDLANHVAKMKAKHPDWSDRQAKCCLYWQGSLRKELKKDTNAFLKQHPGYEINNCPEGMGVNVTQTLKKAGYNLEWPPKNIVCKVAFAAVKRANI